MDQRVIRVVGAREHNLRNLTLDIPRDRLVVLTGLSGSGKSTLAYDTLYAEGQRRYVESLSVHARLFLEQLPKPDVDRIEGLPPTIAIEQRLAASNPRSTVATTTEIYDFLRLLFARVGTPHCPRCGRVIHKQTVDQVVDAILRWPAGTRVMVLAPLARGHRGDLTPLVQRIVREGFVRARVNGELCEARDAAERAGARRNDLDAVVDRLVVKSDARSRLADAVGIALGVGEGVVVLSRGEGDPPQRWADLTFSDRHTCPDCAISLPPLSPRMFSFNSPYGACDTCGGLGTVVRFHPELILTDRSLSLADGAVAPWCDEKGRLAPAYKAAVRAFAAASGAAPTLALSAYDERQERILLHGTRAADEKASGAAFDGVIPELEKRVAAAKGDAQRAGVARFQADLPCDACGGARLRPEALAVRIEGRNIREMSTLSIESAAAFFDGLHFAGEHAAVADPILREVRHRLAFMNQLGVGYLTLDRASVSLSGGEAQRIRLATQIGSGLVGVCYVLDEPTIGLHPRDTQRLLHAMRRLVEAGNSVLVVEHDEDVIRAADHVFELGPGAGQRGGQIVAQGPPEAALRHPQSITGKYLSGEYRIEVPERRRAALRSAFVEVRGARANNLRNLDVRFPLGVLCAVTGVSGSGKSTLVMQILVPALRRRLRVAEAGRDSPRSRITAGLHDRLVGANKIDRVVQIDQTPIGRSPRSNPATFTGAFDEIRRLYARTREAKMRGYGASRFSFNVKGGRCEACQGQGTRRIEMQFLPDVFVECQECRGRRYSRETLDVRYRGKSIADVLDMRVEEAAAFFENFSRIRHWLRSLADVGLGYVRLGQSSHTLSGGEAQRVKLAAELGAPAGGHTLYVLDEPTTGLHLADIHVLLAVLDRLVAKGNTVLVIEHNLDVIASADWVVDLGPEGGDAGGRVVAEGTPEQVAQDPASHTGRHLRIKLAALTGARG